MALTCLFRPFWSVIHLGSIGPLGIDSRPQCVHELDEIAVRRRFGLQKRAGRRGGCESRRMQQLIGF